MLVRKTLRFALLATLAYAGPVCAQQTNAADATSRSYGNFVITPSNPDAQTDPEAFALNEPLMAIGREDGDRMTMPVEIAGVGPYPFIIDTGSQRTIISTELARRLALPPLPPVEIISIAGRVTVSAVQLDRLRFGDHSIESLAALTIAGADMGSIGIIGLDSLKNKRLTMDFVKRRMEVGVSRSASAHEDENSIVVSARSRFGQLILVNSRIDGQRVNVILDTGAEFSIGNMALFRSLKLKKLVVPPRPTVLTSVTGVEVPAQFAVVRRLTIGTVALDNVPMVFLDAAPFDELDVGNKPAMLLGMGMLRMFDRIAIDFGHRHVDFHVRPKIRGAGDTWLADVGAVQVAPR